MGNTVLSHLPGLPDFRLRAINKMFMKSFIQSCPSEQYNSVLLPVLSQMLPFMLNHMTERWAYLRRVRESPGFDEDNTDSKEVLEDVVLRVTAREYLDTLRAVLTSGTEEVGQTADPPPQASQVSPLGEAVLREP